MKRQHQKHPRTNLGKCLRAHRLLSDLTIRDLAQRIGLSPSTLMRVEHGYALDARTLMAILNWLATEARP